MGNSRGSGLANNIKALREITGFTQEKMAEELDISYSHYKKLETGAAKPSYELLDIISKYHNVPFDFLTKDDGWKISSEYANSEMVREMREMDAAQYKMLCKVISFLYLNFKEEQYRAENME